MSERALGRAEIRAAGAAAPPLRSVALPVEHGGWGLLAEPIVLGLALGPSRAGLCLALAATAAFLARHPLRLAMGDRRRGAQYPRTTLAVRVALAYLAAASLALAAALGLGAGPVWVPIALAAPFAVLQLRHDFQGRSREPAAELAGAVALTATVAAIALAGGLRLEAALLLWLVLAARAATAILYVRARLRLDRGLAAGIPLVLLAHAAVFALAAGLAVRGALPWLAVAALGVLLARAAHGLSRRRQPLKPKQLGFQELGFGSLVVLLLVIGFAFGV